MLTLIRKWLNRDTRWDWYFAEEPQMWMWRRRVAGQWQYRAMTPGEVEEMLWWRAIK